MIWLIVFLTLVVIVLLARLLYIKYEILALTKQLKYINKNKSDNKLVVGLLYKDFEELTLAINENIEIRKQCEASRIRTENTLKNAISDMSHDLRTPLTSVIGYLQFLKLDNITEAEGKEYVEIAYQRAKFLERLLNDFYTLSLIDSPEYEINLEMFDLSKLLRELVVSRYGEFASKKFEMILEIPEKRMDIIGDKRAVERVIENLLSNIIKYAKDQVEISLDVEENMVVLKMNNNVNHVIPDELERFFDRFYISDKTRSGQGTGLGLSIAKSLMEKMKGNIKVSTDGNMIKMRCEFKRA